MNVKKSISALLLFFVMVMSLAGCGAGGGTTASAGNSSSSSFNGSTGGASSVGSKVIKLAWNPPQPETGVIGYKVYYGTSSGTYTSSINVGMTPSYTISGLAPGTYYFTVTAIYAPGNESIYSNEASQTIS